MPAGEALCIPAVGDAGLPDAVIPLLRVHQVVGNYRETRGVLVLRARHFFQQRIVGQGLADHLDEVPAG